MNTFPWLDESLALRFVRSPSDRRRLLGARSASAGLELGTSLRLCSWQVLVMCREAGKWLVLCFLTVNQPG